ncbi:hypothetical protein C5167_049457 [Papaver somniferum]|uniref:PWWP domain-containing protein n=1 Tax=Papaver somniferum TaxID=3469 RepID=A0A4Y7KQ21_PAPSO|nr:uncharacterized protein LOC113301785 [Papaver somniferum]RZC73975.1 hypothetical protein C5167_049457 [Papaver somniferum]
MVAERKLKKNMKFFQGKTKEGTEMIEESNGLGSNYACDSEIMTDAFGLEAEIAISYGFEPGSLVWAKVKSHPWWPGYILSEAFASPSVRKTKRKGHILVVFFGDASYGWFDPAKLIPFEPYYSDKSQQMQMKAFTKAVEEAVDEIRRRAALGLACCCRFPHNFEPTKNRGYYNVELHDYEEEIYSLGDIKKARDDFQPGEVLSFIQQVAVNPRGKEEKSIDWIKNITTALALRSSTYLEVDETYVQALKQFKASPESDADRELDQEAALPSQAPLSEPFGVDGELKEKNALGRRSSRTKRRRITTDSNSQ